MHRFARFLGGDIPIAAVTGQLIERFNADLSQHGMVRNTVSFYMRILRSVYNKAVHNGLAEQTAPFKNVYTGIDRTRKRAVGENVIARFIGLDLPQPSQLALTRDLFLFAFYTRGMAFVDMAYLRVSISATAESATSAARRDRKSSSAWSRRCSASSNGMPVENTPMSFRF